MRFPTLSLALLAIAGFAASPSLPPEAPLVAHASGIFRAASPVVPTSPIEILKLHQEGDANLAFGAITGRWIADRLADGKAPDAFLFQRMLAGFTWDDGGVLQLSNAGVDKGILRALATAKPLGLSPEAQDRLTKAGLDSRIAAMLAAPPPGPPPPMGSIADQAMSAMAAHPMANSPMFKAQFERMRKKIETEMGAKFRSEGFRKEIWDRVLENWRSRIQVGLDARGMIAPMETQIVNAPPEGAGAGASGMFGGAVVGNDLFLKSSPLAIGLGAVDVLTALKSRASALIRPTKPKDVETFRFEETTHFLLRLKPSDIVLMRLQDDNGIPTARVTKGTFLGREFKPADEPVPVEVSQDGDAWTVRPRGRLAPGAYAFMMGGQNVVFVPFTVK